MLTARSKIHFQNVEPADVAIDSIDDGALVDEHVIHSMMPVGAPDGAADMKMPTSFG